MLDEAKGRGPAAARMAGISLRTCSRWGASKRVLAAAPTFTLPEKTAERERVLGEDELRRLYAAAGTLADLRGKLFRLVMLTGCRRTEIGQLRWAEVHRFDDPALAEIRLPPSRTKSGAGHWIPLSEQARRVLLSVPRVGDSEFVFPGAKTGTSFNDWATDWKAEIDEAIGEPALMLMGHSRSVGTIASDDLLAGRPYSLSPSILDKLLGQCADDAQGRGENLSKTRISGGAACSTGNMGAGADWEDRKGGALVLLKTQVALNRRSVFSQRGGSIIGGMSEPSDPPSPLIQLELELEAAAKAAAETEKGILEYLRWEIAALEEREPPQRVRDYLDDRLAALMSAWRTKDDCTVISEAMKIGAVLGSPVIRDAQKLSQSANAIATRREHANRGDHLHDRKTWAQIRRASQNHRGRPRGPACTDDRRNYDEEGSLRSPCPLPEFWSRRGPWWSASKMGHREAQFGRIEDMTESLRHLVSFRSRCLLLLGSTYLRPALAFSPRYSCSGNGNKDGAMATNANATHQDAWCRSRCSPEQQTADLNLGGVRRPVARSEKGRFRACLGPHRPEVTFYPPQGVAEHQRALKQFRSKAEYYNENPAAADFAERARGAMTYARKTRWTSQAKSKHRRNCAARVL